MNDIHDTRISSRTSRRKSILADFGSNVTLHGFFHVNRERGIRKLLWLILFVGAIAMSVIMFYGVTMNFFEYKTYIATSDFHYYHEDLVLPSVTVCNKIPLIKQGYERVKEIVNITESEFEEFHLKYMSRYQHEYYENYTIPGETKIFEALQIHNITRSEDLFKLFEINKKDMFNDPIAKLFLATVEGDSGYPTCRYDYKDSCDTRETLSWKESLCHEINYFEKNQTPRKGWISQRDRFVNMITVLNLRTTDRFRKSKQVRTTAPYMDLIEGVVLYVNPYGMPHDVPKSTRRLFLVPGMWNFVRIRHTKVMHLPPPFEDGCGKAKFKWVNSSTHRYTRSMCVLDCLLDMKYKECGCVGWEVQHLSDLPICNITQTRCWFKKKASAQNKCAKTGCPADCKEIRYDILVEQLEIRTDTVRESTQELPGWKLNNSETEKYIKSNIIGIQIEYTGNAKVEEHVPAVSWNTLLGTIGGSLGLAMGMSILTIFEFIFFVYDYLLKNTTEVVAPKSSVDDTNRGICSLDVKVDKHRKDVFLKSLAERKNSV